MIALLISVAVAVVWAAAARRDRHRCEYPINTRREKR